MGITPNMGTPKVGIAGMPMFPDMDIIGMGCIGTGEPIGAPGSEEAPYTTVGAV